MITVLTNIPYARHGTRDDFETDEKRYEWQMSIRANYLLLGDSRVSVPVDIIKPTTPILSTNIRWINREELIAGSFMSMAVQGSLVTKAEDVDIYFKSRDDVTTFLRLNPNLKMSSQNDVLVNAHTLGGHSVEFNLIFGVAYEDPADLITHFDIRACSIALDPSKNTVHSVAGSLPDCCMRRIVDNPVPHNTTVARLVKYIKKGFDIDPYQRLFLAELIKSDQYNSDLELSTGYRAID